MLLESSKIPKFEKFTLFVTTREGGDSTGKYEGFNLGIKSGDEFDTVQENRKSLAGVLWKSQKNFTFLNQVHGSDVLVIDPEKTYETYGEYDAVITNHRRYLPVALAADCVPIIVFDEEKEVFGAIHSGWKGTAKNILGNTITKMQEQFGSEIKDIKVVIGPCISPKNYEVDDSVIEHFDTDFYDKNEDGGYQLDLRKTIESQAISAGCTVDNIYHIDICTFENEDLFFSARRDGIESGRFTMGIYIK